MKRRLSMARAFLQKIICCQIPTRYLNTVKFPHPVGIVIGDGARLGKEVRIYQNVTIGLLENQPADAAGDEYPTLQDGVIVYAGAVIAGAITIGAGAVIGANAVITRDVPERAVAFGRNQIMPVQSEAGAEAIRAFPRAADR